MNPVVREANQDIIKMIWCSMCRFQAMCGKKRPYAMCTMAPPDEFEEKE